MGLLFGGLIPAPKAPINLRDLYTKSKPPANEAYWRSMSRGSISNARPNASGRVADAITSGLKSAGIGNRPANNLGAKIAGALDTLTPLGAATSAEDARAAWHQGRYPAALGNALLAAMSALPDGGAAAAKVSHAIIAPLFHGSPHKFDKFALEKIGTGEGAQAYGHGLYFAENPEVAKQYQSTVSLQHGNVDWGNDPASAAAYWLGMHKDRDGAIRTFETVKKQHQAILNRAAKGLPMAPGAEANSLNEIAQADAAIEHIRNGTERKGLGHLYEVKLDANPEDFLNWGDPVNPTDPRIANVPLDLSTKSALSRGDPITGDLLYRGVEAKTQSYPAATAAMRDAGIPGFRYLDQGSRGAGRGTHNYVVFDPSIIDILNRR